MRISIGDATGFVGKETGGGGEKVGGCGSVLFIIECGSPSPTFRMYIDWFLVVTLLAAIGTTTLVGRLGWWWWQRRERLARDMSEWRIPMSKLKLIVNRNADTKTIQMGEELGNPNRRDKDENPVISMRRTFGAYVLIDDVVRAEFVAFRQLKRIKLSGELMSTLLGLRRMKHDNLAQFLGIQLNDGPDRMHIVHALIERGTLEDFYSSNRRVAAREEESGNFEMEYSFKTAFMRDILKGLEYIHRSPVGYHGLLTAATCLIDINWVLKLALYGVSNFVRDNVTAGRIEPEQANLPENMLMSYPMYVCLPPESLREHFRETRDETPPRMVRGTPQGDIYCVAMIFFMMIEHENPFAVSYTGRPGVDLYRDIIDNNRMPVSTRATRDEQLLVRKCEECWRREPARRPTIASLNETLSIVYPHSEGNLADQLIAINRRYAEVLEQKVAEKKAELVRAQTMTMRLLNEMLPASIASALRVGITPPPRNYDSATVMFVQICDFAVFLKRIAPNEIIQLLNDVFDEFDAVIGRHDAYKVETTGETYMVASGVPHENGGRHVCEVADISLEIRDMSYTYKLPWIRNSQLRVRIGFHAGPIAAGVIGIKSPRYCLFGDTVNFASRMQSNCPPNQIQTSEQTARLLFSFNHYTLVKRGIVHVKGKGDVNCFWLNEHQ